ncbi:MAG: hypothetical protein HBSAPP04_18670 [Ignavibacteriaceae bacterium]|nr:MAG: hypothetical protein EDM75_09380 [Chlorobiota bacterium]GJQ33028.1 MAG: hypothetical protein HBSAPP04_18670 [Ignavibacteriaceae bacterium]
MKFDWTQFRGKSLHVTMYENYGLVTDSSSNQPVYEIVFKMGRLEGAFEDGLLLKNERENGEVVRIFIPYPSIKCVEIQDQ